MKTVSVKLGYISEGSRSRCSHIITLVAWILSLAVRSLCRTWAEYNSVDIYSNKQSVISDHTLNTMIFMSMHSGVTTIALVIDRKVCLIIQSDDAIKEANQRKRKKGQGGSSSSSKTMAVVGGLGTMG